MGYPVTGAAPPGAPIGYEFNDNENLTIASTARFAKLWGIISLITGILTLLSGIGVVIFLGALVATLPASSGSSALLKPQVISALGISLIPSSLVNIIGGVFYLQSGSSLQLVVTTQGNDIPLLMDGVRALQRAFMIEAIALAVSFVIGLGIGISAQLGGTS